VSPSIGQNLASIYSPTRLTTPPGRPIKGLPETITVDSDAPASEIFEKIATVSKFSIHRLRVTKGSDGSAVPNAGGVTVHQTGLRNKSAVDVKDLGMPHPIVHPVGHS
jgi:very-long-chain enoyl-CoA reductase